MLVPACVAFVSAVCQHYCIRIKGDFLACLEIPLQVRSFARCCNLLPTLLRRHFSSSSCLSWHENMEISPAYATAIRPQKRESKTDFCYFDKSIVVHVLSLIQLHCAQWKEEGEEALTIGLSFFRALKSVCLNETLSLTAIHLQKLSNSSDSDEDSSSESFLQVDSNIFIADSFPFESSSCNSLMKREAPLVWRDDDKYNETIEKFDILKALEGRWRWSEERFTTLHGQKKFTSSQREFQTIN